MVVVGSFWVPGTRLDGAKPFLQPDPSAVSPELCLCARRSSQQPQCCGPQTILKPVGTYANVDDVDVGTGVRVCKQLRNT